MCLISRKFMYNLSLPLGIDVSFVFCIVCLISVTLPDVQEVFYNVHPYLKIP